jgi:general secretion pathway protein K
VRAARRQQGAALLLAMLTVTLVATLAATALWLQWRSVEVEAAERARTQQAWMLTGALDWTRLILREDARTSQVDHLSEPWALPLQESSLSSFMALDKNHTDDAAEVFLSGQITDLQSRMNVLNLVSNGKLSEPSRQAFGRLFVLLNLPQTQLDVFAENLRLATDVDSFRPGSYLMPQHIEHLSWLGLSPQTLAVLTPYITLLPVRTPVNLNTASAEVLHASVPKLELAQAQRLVKVRASAHFLTVADALKEAGISITPEVVGEIGVASNFFEVVGRLRLASLTVQERSLVERQNLDVKVLWREREVVNAPAASTTPMTRVP